MGPEHEENKLLSMEKSVSVEDAVQAALKAAETGEEVRRWDCLIYALYFYFFGFNLDLLIMCYFCYVLHF